MPTCPVSHAEVSHAHFVDCVLYDCASQQHLVLPFLICVRGILHLRIVGSVG